MSALLNVQNISVRRLINKVDKLGEVNAQIAALKRQADLLKEEIKSSGYDEVIGNRYRAVISTSTRNTLDKEAVATLLDQSQMDLCMKESTSTSISLYDL